MVETVEEIVKVVQTSHQEDALQNQTLKAGSTQVTKETLEAVEGCTGLAQCIPQESITKDIVEQNIDEPMTQNLIVVEELMEQQFL